MTLYIVLHGVHYERSAVNQKQNADSECYTSAHVESW